MPLCKAWLFDGLELGAAAEGPVTTLAGGIAMIADDAAVRQALMTLLSTIPGERVMRPDYGCPLHRLAFSPNDDTTAGLAIHYIREAIMRFEPRVKILRIDAGSSSNSESVEQENILFVRLQYEVLATQQNNDFSFQLDLSGQQR
jgi:phage baseplate assembly protein W